MNADQKRSVFQEDNKPELFLGVVAPSGIPQAKVETEIRALLDRHGYDVVVIKLSDGLMPWIGEPLPDDVGSRTMRLQALGSALRICSGDGAAVAQEALFTVQDERTKRSGDAHRPAANTAYLFWSLKHQAEVQLLRSTY